MYVASLGSALAPSSSRIGVSIVDSVDVDDAGLTLLKENVGVT